MIDPGIGKKLVHVKVNHLFYDRRVRKVRADLWQRCSERRARGDNDLKSTALRAAIVPTQRCRFQLHANMSEIDRSETGAPPLLRQCAR